MKIILHKIIRMNDNYHISVGQKPGGFHQKPSQFAMQINPNLKKFWLFLEVCFAIILENLDSFQNSWWKVDKNPIFPTLVGSSVWFNPTIRGLWNWHRLGGGLLMPALVKTCLGTILTQIFFCIGSVGG